MSYPQPPWTLQGNAIQTLHLVDIDRVRSLIPTELEIISVLPGKTLGVVYLCNYNSESVLSYNELIVAPALIGYRGKIGGWVSHIYVDNPDSVAGGREIWYLPKELADFTWENGDRITVRQGNQMLCSLNYNKKSLLSWHQWLGFSSFRAKDADILQFTFQFEFNIGFIRSKLEISSDSPFSGLNLGQPFLTVSSDNMSLRIHAPEVVGQRMLEYSQVV